MSSTWISDSQVYELIGTAGKSYVLADKACESNVLPRTPSWHPFFHGSEEECLKIIVAAAIDCEGGMIKGGNGRYIKPEYYIERYQKAFHSPQPCDFKIHLRLLLDWGTENYGQGGVKESQAQRILLQHGISWAAIDDSIVLDMAIPLHVDAYVEMLKTTRNSPASLNWPRRDACSTAKPRPVTKTPFAKPKADFMVYTNKTKELCFVIGNDGEVMEQGTSYDVRCALFRRANQCRSLREASKSISFFRDLIAGASQLSRFTSVHYVGTRDDHHKADILPDEVELNSTLSRDYWFTEALREGRYKLIDDPSRTTGQSLISALSSVQAPLIF
jgi:hypothetical protein